MAKRGIKTGQVQLPADAFLDDEFQVRISIMLPLELLKDLKHLSLTSEHQGKYQLLMKDILRSWVQKKKSKRPKSA